MIAFANMFDGIRRSESDYCEHKKKGDEEIKKKLFYMFVLNAFMQIPWRIFYQYFLRRNELFIALKKALESCEKNNFLSNGAIYAL